MIISQCGMLLSHPAEPWMTLPELMLIEFALCGCKSESQPTKHAEPPPDANCNGRPTCSLCGAWRGQIGTQWWWWPSQRNYYLHTRMPVCVRVLVVCWVRFALGWCLCSAPKSKSKSATKKNIYENVLLSNSRQQQRGATTMISKWEAGVVFRYQRPVGARRLLKKLPDLRECSCGTCLTCQTTRARERAFVLKYI